MMQTLDPLEAIFAARLWAVKQTLNADPLDAAVLTLFAVAVAGLVLAEVVHRLRKMADRRRQDWGYNSERGFWGRR